MPRASKKTATSASKKKALAKNKDGETGVTPKTASTNKRTAPARALSGTRPPRKRPVREEEPKPTGKISKNVQDWREFIKNDPSGAAGRKIGKLGALAMLGGRESAAWKEYMTNFAKDQRQLDRLCGRDPLIDFEYLPGDQYGKILLAYVIGGSPCMSGTSLALFEGLTKLERELLDGDV